MWKRLSTRKILNHPRLTVVEDKVELPDGEKTSYLRFEYRGDAPTVIARDKNDKILVIKEYFYVTNEWFYLFPGGFVPISENIETGISRELEEETGIKVGKLTLLGNFYSNIRRTETKVDVFLGEDLEKGQIKLDKEEEIESHWLSEREIDQLIKDNQFKNSSSLAAWAVYKTSTKLKQ